MRRAAEVRGWLRAATRWAEPLQATAAVGAYARDPMLSAIPRRHTPLADAVEAMGQLAAAHARRFVASLHAWHRCTPRHVHILLEVEVAQLTFNVDKIMIWVSGKSRRTPLRSIRLLCTKQGDTLLTEVNRSQMPCPSLQQASSTRLAWRTFLSADVGA
jgi:hypothetical protein